MEKKRNIYNIRSKYILMHILNYIQDNKFKLKLFSYSKDFRNKLDINNLTYYKIYLDAINFDLNKYLFLTEHKYEKGKLKKEYNDFISQNKLNKKQFEKMIYEGMNNQNKSEINERKFDKR